MAAPESNLVPGNIRQQFVPFVLDPSEFINKNDVQSKNEAASPQVFSFRKGDLKGTSDGLLNIYPNDRGQFNKDIGLQQIASYGLLDEQDKGLATLETILNHAPGIQIREYTQDLKIDLVWDLIKMGIKGFQDGEKSASEPSEIDKKTWTARATAVIETFKNNNWWKGITKSLKSSDAYPNDYVKDDYNVFIIPLIKALYYNMMGSTTTNVYVLPCNNNELFNTNGTDGWGDNNGIGGFGTSQNSIFGQILNFVGSNMKIRTQPIWNGNSGSPYGSISIKFTLFNDTMESAMNNFIFVNTIFPQNMFLQYHIFQQPPSVYDIKIEGGRRWFMCSGQFTCNNMGVIRKPHKDFVNTLIDKHRSPRSFITADYINKNNIIKIPDAYDITLNFNSLLPDNFNNYIFQYAMNNNITEIKSREEAFYTDITDYITKTKDKIETISKQASGEEDESKVKEKAVSLVQQEDWSKLAPNG